MLRRRLMWALMPVVMAGMFLFAGCNRPGPEKIANHVVEEITDELKLDASQAQQLNGIKTELLAKFKEMKSSRKTAHEEILGELQKDTVDAEHLKKLAAAHQQEMHGIVDLAIDRLAAFHATLTPEQKKKLVEFIKAKEKCHMGCRFGD